jgi:hypothetical protein
MPEIYGVGIGLLLFPILFGFLIDPLLRLVTKPVDPQIPR